ncbi:hypothetical protein BG011_005458 [Mortierella polycephala]|uniref:Uncharacterized protein n=1 Tax=Mortierella polycephala TaxID=41804 RepID=A0A9P6PYK5_9FUNG|nr:hypothetical protein BG011_005458 [Mortierella polycephala]
MTSPRKIHWGLSGFGPRHALYIIHQAMVILAHRDRLKAESINFELHYTVFEKRDTPGVGNAFQIDCDAAVNTPVTKLPEFLGITDDPMFIALKAFADLPDTVYPHLKKYRAAILDDLRKRNPAAADLFTEAFEQNGDIKRNVACMTRGKWGHIQKQSIGQALDFIQTNVPEIKIEIKYLHEVVNVDFTNPKKPSLVVRKVGESDTNTKYLPFDFVSFAHGTSLVSPLKPEVALRAYSLTPNHDTLRDYLRRSDVIDTKNSLKRGKKIVCTGLGLSFYDYATLLLAFLPGIESSQDPVKFIRDNAKDYQNLITVISRSVRPPAPPRTALNPNWRGENAIFFSAQDMHALRLQRNVDWLSIAYEFLEAHIARSLSKVPKEVKTRESIAEYMTSYSDDNNKYLAESGVTETDLLRAGFVAFSLGSGIEVDVDAAEKNLIRRARYTRNGRFGLPMFTASGFEISSKDKYNNNANSDFFKLWDEQILFNYASPVPIQNIIATMFTSGIARHMQGNFDQIDISQEPDKVKFVEMTEDGPVEHQFDALLAPKVMRRDRDPVLCATKGLVKEIIAGVPDYGKGGYFKTKEGTPINAFDAGMGGCGAKVINKEGLLRTAGARWDGLTNNHHAASVFATQHAYHTLALAIAVCRDPSGSPIETVASIYRGILPDARLFNQEVNRFKPVWEDLQERLLFLRLAKNLAKDDAARYLEITDKIFDLGTRQSFLEQQKEDNNPYYEEQHERIMAYNPPTLMQYEERFADYTRPQYKDILEKSFLPGVATRQEETRQQDTMGEQTCIVETIAEETVHVERADDSAFESVNVSNNNDIAFETVHMPSNIEREGDGSAFEIEYDRNYAYIF